MENFALQLGLALRRRGHDVHAVTSSWERIPEEQTLDGPLRVTQLPWKFKVGSVPIGLAWGARLESLFKEWKTEVVIAHTPVPFMADLAVRAAKRLGLPALLMYQNDLAPRGPTLRLARLGYRPLEAATLRRADAILVTSRDYAASSPILASHLGKVHVVPPGLDSQRFRPTATTGFRTRHGLGETPFALFVGQMETESSHKGPGVLLRAAAVARRHVPGLQLVMAGRGSGIPALQKTARDLGIGHDVHFIGFVPDDDLPALYSEASVVCLPSTSRAEGFGMVLIEAQACGTPVIGSRIGGIPAAVSEGRTGTLVEPANVDALAAALSAHCGSPATKAAMGPQAALWARERFDWDRSAAVVEALIAGASSPT